MTVVKQAPWSRPNSARGMIVCSVAGERHLTRWRRGQSENTTAASAASAGYSDFMFPLDSERPQCRRMPARQCMGPRRPRSPPTRILLSTSRPTACQKPITRQPNSSGISQFHKTMTTALSAAAAIAANSTNFSPCSNQVLFILRSSRIDKFVVNRTQPLPQVQHGIALARQQGVHAGTRLPGELLEASSLEFVGNEHTALLLGQFVQGSIEFFEQEASRVDRFRPTVCCGEQVLEGGPAQLRRLGDRYAFRRLELHALLPSKEIRNAVARDAEQPRADMFDGSHQSRGLDQLVEDLLQEVLCIGRIGHTLANEAAQARALAHERLRDRTIMRGHGPIRTQFRVHTFV